MFLAHSEHGFAAVKVSRRRWLKWDAAYSPTVGEGSVVSNDSRAAHWKLALEKAREAR